VGRALLLHPRGVAEVGLGQDRVVVATGDRDWCSANREATATAEATCWLLSVVRRGAQQAPVAHGPDATGAASLAITGNSEDSPRQCRRRD